MSIDTSDGLIIPDTSYDVIVKVETDGGTYSATKLITVSIITVCPAITATVSSPAPITYDFDTGLHNIPMASIGFSITP
jgi:hypothetical protein